MMIKNPNQPYVIFEFSRIFFIFNKLTIFLFTSFIYFFIFLFIDLLLFYNLLF